MARPSTRRSVGRPPKADSAKAAADGRKTKYLFSGDSPQSSNQISTSISTRRSTTYQSNNGSNLKASSLNKSGRKRKAAKWEDDSEEEEEPLPGKRRGVYLDTYNSSYAYDDDDTASERDEDELEENDDEFAGEDEEDSQLSNVVNTPKQILWTRSLRPRSPPSFQDSNMPKLVLPKCSQDLLLSEQDVNQYLLQICSVYEILRHFKQQLRLSAFRIEEFIASLQLDEMNSLCSEIHITLLKVLVKEDEINSTLIGSTDVKDSVNIHLYCCDLMTWPFALKMYLQARACGQITKNNCGDLEAKRIIEKIYTTNYPIGVTLETKLFVLQYLCDSFLETSIARDEIMNIEALTIRHDDHCRKCHKLGDLLCCDNCPSVWHLSCVDPPMTTVPNNEWICHICKAMNIEEVEAASVRKEMLGWDRHGRKYWWLCQRLIVEESLQVNEQGESSQDLIFYYSTKRQFENLLAALDTNKYEKELCEVLNEMKDDINHGFEIINQCTNNAFKAKGLVIQNIKSWIELDSCTERNEDDELDATVLSESSASAGIVTRLKTGAIQPKSISENGKTNSPEYPLEDRDVLYYWDPDKDNLVLKRTHKKQIPQLSSLLFKLGMEGRGYANYFNINILAMNKYQQQEERDKRRQLSWKFSLTPLSEFKWIGPINGSRVTLIQTLRQTIVHLEGSLHSAFLHPNWALHRSNWLKAVQMCDNAKDFALALSILESSIKPLLFNPVWNDSIGHNLLERVTLLEREERKKNEKRERREAAEELDMLIRLGGVKYSLMPNRSKDGVWSGQGAGRGVHQLWKQKGEEYRVTGKGGWIWRSATRVQIAVNKPLEIYKIDELSQDEINKVEQTELINVMREIAKEKDVKRIYYPKHFKKDNKPKLLFLENLLERRIKLKAAIEVETQKLKGQTDLFILSNNCYSPTCRSETNNCTTCYSFECRRKSGNSMDFTTEPELDQVFYCVKPVYLYKLNERNEIIRKLNAKRVLGKGQLPPCAQFSTKSQKKSIFVLPRHEMKKLSRTAGLKEVRGFSYTAKYNPYIWPFGTTPRPLFRTCWLYRNSIIEKHHGIEGVALSLRILWVCIRWDDMSNKPPLNGINTITTDSEVITTELLKRRDLPPFGLRSEYLVRKIVVPLDYENEKDDNEWKDSSRSNRDTVAPAWKREGLRERKKKVDLDAETKRQGPSVTEQWTIEEELQLWEIKGFGEKLEKQQQMMKDKEKERVQKEHLERTRRIKEENARKSADERRKQLELNRVNQNKNSILSGTTSEGYAMIRTIGGQTYRVPYLTLQGKKVGEQIAIKLTNPNVQPTTTTATIIQVVPPVHSKSEIINNNSIPIRSAGISGSSVTATGISSSSLISQSGQKFQVIRPASTISTGQQSAITPGATTTTTQGITHTIKVSTNGTVGLAPNSMLQIPIRLPDNRIQMLQLPASMLNANRPIQITIPPTTNSPTPQMIQLTTTTSSLTNEQINNLTNASKNADSEIRSQSNELIKNKVEQNIKPEKINKENIIAEQSTKLKIKNELIDHGYNCVLPEDKSTNSDSHHVPQELDNVIMSNQSNDLPEEVNNCHNNPEAKPTVQINNTMNSPAINLDVQANSLSISKNQFVNPSTNVSSNTPSNVTYMDKKNANLISRGIGRSRAVRTSGPLNSATNSLSSHTHALSNEDRDQLAIKTLMKAMLDKIEKDDKLETKRKKSRENQMLTKWRQQSSRNNLRLQLHMEQIKKEILHRRATAQQVIASEMSNSSNRCHEQNAKFDFLDDATVEDGKMNKNDCDGSKQASNVSDVSNATHVSHVSHISRVNHVDHVSNGEFENSASSQHQMINVDGDRGADVKSKTIANNGGANNNAQLSNLPNQPCFDTCNVTTSGDSTVDQSLNNNDLTDLVEKQNHNQENKLFIDTSDTSDDKIIQKSTRFNNSISVPSNSNNINKRPIITDHNTTNVKRVRSMSNCKMITENVDNSVAGLSGSNVDYQSTDLDQKHCNKSKKLYCICRQPYDSKRFMVGCDYCHNWFHCDCLRVEEELVKRLDSFVCAKCRVEYADELDEDQLKLVLPLLDELQKSKLTTDKDNDGDHIERLSQVVSPKVNHNSIKKELTLNKKTNKKSSSNSTRKKQQQLYCICRKPYNESQFYVQCEKCSEWLHGRCVGVLCKEAEQIDVYLCPQCDPNSTINYANQKSLDATDFSEIRKLLKQIQQHKNAWPFLRPVDERQVPDYYSIITEPMDLATIENKLNQQAYKSLTFFIGDITKIFDNCRYYNDKRSSITHCADLLENFFVQKIKCLRQNMIGR